jgi:hypothetical protein
MPGEAQRRLRKLYAMKQRRANWEAGQPNVWHYAIRWPDYTTFHQRSKSRAEHRHLSLSGDGFTMDLTWDDESLF